MNSNCLLKLIFYAYIINIYFKIVNNDFFIIRFLNFIRVKITAGITAKSRDVYKALKKGKKG